MIKAICKAGIIAGTLDILAAFLMNLDINPLAILRYIASGLVGSPVFSWGLPGAILGLFLHYCIATIWAAIFFFIYPKLHILSKNKYISGLSYGIIIWLVMNLIVVPLSGAPSGGIPHLLNALKGTAVLMVCVGLPVSIVVSKYYSKKESL